MTSKIILQTVLLLGFAAPAILAHGQSSPSLPQSPEPRSRLVLEKALNVLGIGTQLKSIDSLLLRARGSEFRSAELQGPDLQTPTRAFHEETIVVFPNLDRLLYEHRTGRHDGSFRWRRWVYTGEQRTVVDFRSGLVGSARDPAAGTERSRVTRTIPHLLLLEASKVPELRWVESRQYEGKQHDVLNLPLPGTKTVLSLFVAGDSHLLTKFQYTMDFPGLGDATVEYVYPEYLPHKVLGWFPAGYKIRLDGQTVRDVRYTEVSANSSQATEAFELPAQLASLTAPIGEAVEVAKGAFIFLTGSLNPMFVEFEDFVLAVEAPAQAPLLERVPADSQPGSTQVTERFIKKIKETIPNKPIRYLVLTHFHSDHAGGARAFMAEGTTIITTSLSKRYFETLAASSISLMPDRLAVEPRPPSIETLKTKRTITDGNQTVELFNVGPSPHSQENVIVYLPRERVLFQGDLFYFDGLDRFPARDPSRDRVMKFFGGWLLKNGLNPARIYGFHDRGFATMKKQVRQILKLKRSEG